MEVECFGGPEPVLVPHVGHERLASDHAPGRGEESCEEVELFCAQNDFSFAAKCSSGAKVDDQSIGIVTIGCVYGKLVERGVPSEMGAKSGENDGEAERLGDVVGCSGVEANDEVEFFVSGCEHDDRYERVEFDETPTHIEAVGVGESEIKEHQVESVGLGTSTLERKFTFASRRGPCGAVSVAIEGSGEGSADAFVVFDDENSSGVVHTFTVLIEARMLASSVSVWRFLAEFWQSACRALETSFVALQCRLFFPTNTLFNAKEAHMFRFRSARPAFALVAVVAVVVTIAGASAVSSTAASAARKRAAPKTKAATTRKPASRGAVYPNAPEVVAPGDIPDNQLFVPYRPTDGGWTVSVPEGWGRTETNGAVTFTDKYNSITVTASKGATAPTTDTVRVSGLVDISSDPTYRAGKITTVKTGGGPAIKATFEIGSAPNKVTGKKALLAVERYVYFGKGTQVVVTLSGAKGADNVDPWKTVTDSVRVG
jgi:hypothetical protein